MFDKLRYSFPIQLLLNHVKNNHALLFLWIMLFLIVTGNFGTVFGIPYLFLDPEYHGQTNFWSFFIVGISIGGYIMAFHIVSYIVDAERFKFLGTLTKPFTKFSINNSIIPLGFLITYFIAIIRFQYFAEDKSGSQIIILLLGFILGIMVMVILLYIYFWTTNKDVFKIVASRVDKKLKKSKVTRAQILKRYRTEKHSRVRVDNYLNLSLKLKIRFKTLGEKYQLFDRETILKVFDQNHLNSVIIQSFIIVSILIIGAFRDVPFFQIPAAASGILFFTILVMLVGSISFWTRKWTIAVIIALLVFCDYVLLQSELFSKSSRAYGLNYNITAIPYNEKKLKENNTVQNIESDKHTTQKILEAWKAKFPPDKKPKMIFLCASGGGLRSTLWTTTALQAADSLTNGQLIKQTMLMTGASGGMVGLAFYRELYLQKQQQIDIDIYSKKHLHNVAKDNLNPVIFTLLINDLFIPFPQYFKYNGQEYLKDRGYAFEQQFNKNTNYILDKPLSAYKTPVTNSIIPLAIMSPTIMNDGRKLYISSQQVSYMNTVGASSQWQTKNRIRGIDFLRFFKDYDAEKLKYLTALRMGATFPYVFPNVTLPSDPPLEIMDGGIADNFGIVDAVKFLYNFKDWISQNTSGVLIISIRDSEKNRPIEKNTDYSIIEKLFTPINSIYSNWDNIQDFNNESALEFAETWFDGRIDKVEVEYSNVDFNFEQAVPTMTKKEQDALRASLSWRLTEKEKKHIMQSIYSTHNQEALKRISNLLSE